MSLTATLFNGALDILSIAVPAAGPAIGIFKTAEPYIEAGLPVLVEAIKEGPAAFRAAQAAAPELSDALARLASMVKHGTPNAAVTDHDVAVVAHKLAGLGPPGWTDAETRAWWDRASGAY